MTHHVQEMHVHAANPFLAVLNEGETLKAIAFVWLYCVLVTLQMRTMARFNEKPKLWRRHLCEECPGKQRLLCPRRCLRSSSFPVRPPRSWSRLSWPECVCFGLKPTSTSSTSRNCSVRKWPHCSFLCSMLRSLSLLMKQMVKVSRSKTLSRVGTAVIERQGSIVSCTHAARELPQKNAGYDCENNVTVRERSTTVQTRPPFRDAQKPWGGHPSCGGTAGHLPSGTAVSGNPPPGTGGTSGRAATRNRPSDKGC